MAVALLAGSLFVTGCAAESEEATGVPGPDDPGVIVFTGGAGDGELIHAIRPDGSGLRPLAVHERCEEPIEFSSDGRMAACWSHQPAGGSRRLYVVRLDGSGWRRVPLPPGESIWPSLSPDGSELVFLHASDASEPHELWKVGMDGEGPRRLVDGENGPADWSPDGRRIAFVRSSGASDCGGELVVMDADGGEQQVIANESSVPQWSRDGKRIAFLTVGCENPATISTVPSEGGSPTLVARDVAEVHSFAWSLDGKSIAFLRLATPLGWGWTVQIFVAPAAGGEPRPIGPTVSDAPAGVFWLPSSAVSPHSRATATGPR